MALGRLLATGETRYGEELALLDAWLLDQVVPDIYDEGDNRNVLTRQRRQFGATCAALAAQGFPRAQELSLFEFHSALEYLLAKNHPA